MQMSKFLLKSNKSKFVALTKNKLINNMEYKSFTENTVKQSDRDDKGNLKSVDEILKKYIPKETYDDVAKIYYGRVPESIPVVSSAAEQADQQKFEIGAYKISALKEQLRSPRIVRIGAIQTKFPANTSLPVKEQLRINFERYEQIIKGAHLMGVNVLGLQETWTAPFFFCTRENYPWLEFAESPTQGESVNFIRKLAEKYNMVIVSSILERDDYKETIHNTAIVIDNHGDILGKHRKIHIPRVGDFNESTYYFEGDLGCTVFETEFGKVGVNICYGRHHPLHWLAYNLNGAEIVFNPSATVNTLSETMWPIEARNAAIANNYFSIGINRVGTEHFPNAFTSGNGKESHHDFGHFYGSTYLTAPDGIRTPGLSRTEDGLLVAEVDLNMCRQIKDSWKFSMTGRHGMYAKMLSEYVKPDFKPDLVRKKPENIRKEQNPKF